MRTTIKIPLRTTHVENEAGVYEVWVEKRFCFNEYRFRAKQIAVRLEDGQLYYVQNQETFLVHKLESTNPFISDDLPTDLKITKFEYHLGNYSAYFRGSIIELKFRFEMFCCGIQKEAKNVFRIINW